MGWRGNYKRNWKILERSENEDRTLLNLWYKSSVILEIYRCKHIYLRKKKDQKPIIYLYTLNVLEKRRAN